MGKVSTGEGIVPFSDKLNEMSSGLELNWNDLLELVNPIYQIYDMEIRSDLDTLKTIACVDGSFWEIETNDVALVSKIKKIFRKVEIEK